jgi:Polyketide cyclase / dehydrase and lipid transport
MRPLVLLLLLLAVCFAAERVEGSDANEGWKLANERGGVTIYSRPHPGSSLKEFKALGEIPAPSRAVCEVIEDVDNYTKFMPYMAECKLLKRDTDSLLSYQRISPRICSDRDFTLRTYRTSWSNAAGIVYSNRWESANALGPPKKPGVVRVPFCQGSWLLEPTAADRTRATYSVYTDTGGLIPPFIANHFSLTGIREIFAAVRKQVIEPKYNGQRTTGP